MELISPAKIMLEFGDTLCPFLKVNWHWISNKGLLSDKGLKKALKKLRKKNKTIPSLSPSLGLRPHN